MSVIESIRELSLHLPQVVNELRLQVGILVKGDTFQHLDELLYHQVVVYVSIIACVNEMCNVLLRVVISMELLEL